MRAGRERIAGAGEGSESDVGGGCEAEVPDLVESGGQGVSEESREKLDRFEPDASSEGEDVVNAAEGRLGMDDPSGLEESASDSSFVC